MPEIEVALPVPLPGTFTYSHPQVPPPGTRVIVPFGPRKLVGVVLGVATHLPANMTLRAIDRVLDEKPAYSAVMLEIARWLSGYYMHPLGEVLKAMLPASSTQSKQIEIRLTEAGETERASGFSPEGRLLRKAFGLKRSSLLLASLKRKLEHLSAQGDDDAATTSLDTLLKLGLIQRDKKVKVAGRRTSDSAAMPRHETPHEGGPGHAQRLPLTPLQQSAFELIVRQGLGASQDPSPFLLHGVTGSGKTEIYLQLIAETLERSAHQNQTLVLVPEISLTPQMTRVFEQRFPGIVAVVHSAMADPERWSQLARIRENDAKILIGPRSAVFGPFRQLRLIIVDEEHDGSYKQSTGLTYNGRDVAVLRGHMEKAVVVLGSATPSMESYRNALLGRYTLVELPERVTGRALPEIEVIGRDSAPLKRRAGTIVTRNGSDAETIPTEVPVAPEVLAELRSNLAHGHQAIVLVNRRGYAFYLYAIQEKKTVQCPHCSISLTLHERGSVLRCHYCDYSTTMHKMLTDHPHETFATFGYGSQKAEDYLCQQLNDARITRIDSDAVVKRDVLPRTLNDFRNGKIDILVGTQILAKGHDFPNVTLIAILEVDQLLALPDFRAGERTFQLIVQAAGRAGRAELKGRVLIQCARAENPVVSAAIRQDYNTFATAELAFRAQHDYPPFARMIVFEFNSEKESHLQTLTTGLEGWFDQLMTLSPQLLTQVRVLGPAAPPIEMIRGRHRRTLILSSKDQASLRKLATMLHDQCARLPGDVRMTIDVDPQSLI